MTHVDVLFVLGTRLAVRNWAANGVLEEAARRGLTAAIVSPRNSHDELEAICPEGFRWFPLDDFHSPPFRKRLLGWFRLMSFIARSDRRDYREKLKMGRPNKLGRFLLKAICRVVGVFRNPEKVCAAIVEKFEPVNKAKDVIAELNPRLVVWPTSISDMVDFEVILAARKRGIPLLASEQSWDNLTTKGAFYIRPEKLLVWGAYSKEKAFSEHSFKPDEVSITGTPQFDIYRNVNGLKDRGKWFAERNLDSRRKLILFGGATISKYNDERMVLNYLSQAIDQEKLPPSYICYRPHPRAKIRIKNESLRDIPNVIIDYGLDGKDGATWAINSDDARERAEGLLACDIVITPFSTMLIEAALLGKPSVVLNFWIDRDTNERHFHPYVFFSHIQSITISPFINGVESEEDLLETANTLLKLNPAEYSDALRGFGRHFAELNPQGVGVTIVDEVAKLIPENPQMKTHV